MVINMTLATLIGTITPFLLKSLKIDPAIASGPVIATTIDVIGLFIYYMILLGSPSSDEGEKSFYLYCLGWAAASLALLGAIGTIYWMFTAMIK